MPLTGGSSSCTGSTALEENIKIINNNNISLSNNGTIISNSNNTNSIPATANRVGSTTNDVPMKQQPLQQQQQQQQSQLSDNSSSAGINQHKYNIHDLVRWVPLRLTDVERSLLTVLEQTLHVSEYTDQVDVTISSYSNSYGNNNNSSMYSKYKSINGTLPQHTNTYSNNIKVNKIVNGIYEICHIATGLAAASIQEKKFIELCNQSVVQQQQQITTNDDIQNNYNDDAVSCSTTDTTPGNNGRKGSSSTNGLGISSRISSLITNSVVKKTGTKNKKSKLSKEERKIEKTHKKEEKRLLKLQKKSNKQLTNINMEYDSSANVSMNITTNDDIIDNMSTTSNTKTQSKLLQLKIGQSLVCNSVQDNELFFQTMFEIGRRQKILSPTCMRNTYGKLMYMLQDSQNPIISKLLQLSFHKDIITIYKFLHSKNCLQLLNDNRLHTAIQYIADTNEITGSKYNRTLINQLQIQKQTCINELVVEYSSSNNTNYNCTEYDIRRVIESLDDAIVYIESNSRPIRQMIQYLQSNFHPTNPDKVPSTTITNNGNTNTNTNTNTISSPYSNLSLRESNVSTNRNKFNVNSNSNTSTKSYPYYGISAYTHGNNERPTLHHIHSEQYTFVEQSLKLWNKVMRHMHELWICADSDLLSTTCSYHLYNTGQGLNRVQQCSRVRSIMSNLLGQTQNESGKNWVGLSVIHLGDRDVPNALIFIDKYTQISRFLYPIVSFVQSLSSIMNEPKIAYYIAELYGTTYNLQMAVLQDYFKHGFDGSGDDGGSCIDGRITSSWNWTSRIAKKQYYYPFMISGFQGFDGKF